MATRSKLQHGVEIKSADKGEVSAVIATLNVKDHDGDVATEETFTPGAEVVISSYNHSSMYGASLPVGKGKIRVASGAAILDGKFWIENLPEARSAFEVVKQMGTSQEWSYGYKVIDSEPGTFDGERVQFLKAVDVFEASPVIRGAGLNTHTLSVKGLKDGAELDPADAIERVRAMSEYRSAIRPHETLTSLKAWLLRDAEAKLGEQPTILDLRSMYAWVDPTGDPEVKGSYAYPHHDGPGGPANIRACLAGIAKLNYATATGPGIPDGDRRGVYNHLAAHVFEAEITPSDLTSGKGESLKFSDQLVAVLAAEQEMVERSSGVLALRRSKGKTHAAFSALALEWSLDNQKALRSHLDTPQVDAARELARFIQIQQQLAQTGV
jgi:hypothetical protein